MPVVGLLEAADRSVGDRFGKAGSAPGNKQGLGIGGIEFRVALERDRRLVVVGQAGEGMGPDFITRAISAVVSHDNFTADSRLYVMRSETGVMSPFGTAAFLSSH